MAYRRLSDQVKQLVNAQRSDAFLRHFREAVRTGEIEATYLAERFTLPKTFVRRGSRDTFQKDAREMVFEVTPKFERWFTQINRELATSRKGSAPKPTQANIEAGLVDFRALAQVTRQKMQASHQKGQALGRSRKGQGKRAAEKAPVKAGARSRAKAK